MTQHEIIVEYVKANGSIIPACLTDKQRAFNGEWIGSEAGKRCRELRGKIQGVWKNPYGRQMLDSIKYGKFEKFSLLPGAENYSILLPMTDKIKDWNKQFQKSLPVKQEIKQSLF